MVRRELHAAGGPGFREKGASAGALRAGQEESPSWGAMGLAGAADHRAVHSEVLGAGVYSRVLSRAVVRSELVL